MIWQYLTLTTILNFVTSIFIPLPSPGTPLPAAQSEEAQKAPLPKPSVDVFEYQADHPTGYPPRLSFGYGSGLHGFPSAGGVWMLDSPHPVLLQHLSIDRFTPILSQRESDPVAEDAFCNSLKKRGATWWRSFYAILETEEYPDRPKPDHIYTGWPKNGGVWFLQLTETEFIFSRVGLLAMALDMDEYCKVLEEIGATFYEDPKACEYLKDVV